MIRICGIIGRKYTHADFEWATFHIASKVVGWGIMLGIFILSVVAYKV